MKRVCAKFIGALPESDGDAPTSPCRRQWRSDGDRFLVVSARKTAAEQLRRLASVGKVRKGLDCVSTSAILAPPAKPAAILGVRHQPRELCEASQEFHRE